MAEESFSHLQEAVVNNSNWVNKVLIAGELLAGTIVLLKLTGKTSFKWGDVEFSTNKAWLVFSLFTLAHLYTAWLFINSTHELWKTKNQDACRRAFNKVVSSGGLFVRGLIPRTKKVSGFYRMSWRDPSTVISLLAALMIILAIVPFELTDEMRSSRYLIIAVLIAAFNWLVGSNWAVALSELALEHYSASYHMNRLYPRGPSG